eukprot:540438-Rhodomonas_salina.4
MKTTQIPTAPASHSALTPSFMLDRTKLTPEQALEIFSLRPKRSERNQTFLPSAALNRELSGVFKCGERTIRDIGIVNMGKYHAPILVPFRVGRRPFHQQHPRRPRQGQSRASQK